MYRCDVCRAASSPGAAKVVYKGVALCRECHSTVKALEKDAAMAGPKPLLSVAELVARDLIASWSQPARSPPAS